MNVMTFKSKDRSGTSLRGLGDEDAVAAPSLQVAPRAPLGVGGWIGIVVMLGFLLASIALAFWGWNLTDAKISTGGVVSLVLGVVVTIALGGGLMALVFWSSRNGYDG